MEVNGSQRSCHRSPRGKYSHSGVSWAEVCVHEKLHFRAFAVSKAAHAPGLEFCRKRSHEFTGNNVGSWRRFQQSERERENGRLSKGAFILISYPDLMDC